MNTHSSGYYSIDEEYTIIGFNDTAKEIYPNLQKGIKCYKALMGLDSPCPPCPVMNKIYGPRTYLDPIRKIYETVDAVELKLSDEKVGHAMVFSTVAEGERLASAIPTGEKALRLVGAINLLASDYVAVYGVSRQTGAVSVYRSQYQLEGDEKSIDRDTDDRMQYDILREAFIKKYVHPDEQAYMFEQTELSMVQERLSQTSGFKLHCRIKTTQTHYYYLMIARDGEVERYEDFVIALVCEDDDVARISRYAARLFVNPANDHLEAVLYGKDVTAVQEAYETQVSIVKTLSSNYLNVYLIHSREKTLSIIKQEDYTVSESDRKNENVYAYEDFFDKYINECVYPEDRLMMQEALQFDNVMETLSGEKEYKGNYRIVKEGKIQYYQFRFIRDEESGIIVLGFLNVDDVVAKEIHQKRLLQEALSTAKQANAAKSNFLSRMSHDMRTPLNGIIGLLEIDKKHEEDTTFLKKNREKANIAANHLLSLINDVLDMSKIEEGELVLSHEPFNVIEQGKEIMTIISMQAYEQGITTVMEVEPEVYENPYIYGSPLHLSRAMMNIYSNCIKYNKENGEIRTHVRLLHSDKKILTYQWTISDTGIGISEDYLNRIFEPFTQEGTDARSVYQGTGLGMSIAKALFEQMGGSIEVFSKQGEGSTFVITLPFERAQELKTTVIEKTERESIQDIKILLAEDNELNQEVARILLEEEGAEVFCVNNGQKAVEVFSTHPAGSYDLILMDIMMPVMGGYEATRQIRRLDRTDAQSIPIIALTANAFAEDIQHAMDAGMNAHVAKPLNIKTIKK